MKNVESRNEIGAFSNPRESFSNLIGDLIRQISNLLKNEIALATVQIQEKASAFVKAGAVIATGIGIGVLALMSFLVAGIIALGTRIGVAESSAVAGGLLAVLGIILILVGRSLLRRIS